MDGKNKKQFNFSRTFGKGGMPDVLLPRKGINNGFQFISYIPFEKDVVSREITLDEKPIHHGSTWRVDLEQRQ